MAREPKTTITRDEFKKRLVSQFAQKRATGTKAAQSSTLPKKPAPMLHRPGFARPRPGPA